MAFTTPIDRSNRYTLTAALLAFGMIAIIGSALAFEHIGGFAPCALCLEQRAPYYAGIPFVLIALISSAASGPVCVVRGGIMIGFLCLVATAVLGAYHSGVEWGFFPGPASCGAGLDATSSDAGSLLNSLSTAKPPSCTDAAGRFLGLSFAGWNVVAAGALAIIAFKGAFAKPIN